MQQAQYELLLNYLPIFTKKGKIVSWFQIKETQAQPVRDSGVMQKLLVT